MTSNLEERGNFVQFKTRALHAISFGPQGFVRTVLVESALMGTLPSMPNDVQLLLGLPPPPMWDKLAEFKRRHARHAALGWGHYIHANQHALAWLAECVSDIDHLDKRSWPPYRPMQIAFLPGAIEGLYHGLDSWVEGFYDEASAALRSPFEALLRIIFISCHPYDQSAAFDVKRPKGRRFNLTTFVRDELKIDWLFIWKLNSRKAHGNLCRAIEHAVSAADNKDHRVAVEFKYDDAAITAPMNQSTFLAWCYLRLLNVLFPNLIAWLKPEARERCRIIDSGIRKLMEGSQVNKFPQAIHGMLKIESIIATAERGEDWRPVANASPIKPADGSQVA